MLVGKAKDVARRWVAEEGVKTPGFDGAYFAGSANWLPDDAVLPPASDLDLNVIVAAPHTPSKRAKFTYDGVLLEITCLAGESLASADAVLGHYHLAGGLATASVILDPSGRLAALQAAVRAGYAKRHWVRARCQQARDGVVAMLASLQEASMQPDQVTAVLFGTGVTTHVLLVAGMRNPTVRRRYVAVRDLLDDYGLPAEHEPLLELLGSAHMSRQRVEAHLVALAKVYDAAAAAMRSSFPFSSDVSPLTRPIAIDGGREMIEQGYPREAVFWIAATYCRCMKVLAVDAPPEVAERHTPGFQALRADLGVASFADLERRAEQVRAYLPHVWDVAEAIMAANPAIEE